MGMQDLDINERREVYTAIALLGLVSQPNPQGFNLGKRAVRIADQVLEALNEPADTSG